MKSMTLSEVINRLIDIHAVNPDPEVFVEGEPDVFYEVLGIELVDGVVRLHRGE